MFGVRKQQRSQEIMATPLAIRAAGGESLFEFRPEVVNSLRHMVTGLACNGDLPARLSVVSALREEGVTHTALALGTVLASDTAATVCVVELNWWRPGMRAILAPHDNSVGTRTLPSALTGNAGLAGAITGNISLDEAIVPTALPNLSLVAAGELAVEQRPVIARSSSLKEAIDGLAARYDHLILDVPAVLATSDAIVLASLGDACVMVVRHGVTPTASVQLALDDIRHLNMLGVILNQASFATPRWVLDLVPQE